MATVYLAHDPRHERKVAIKVLHPELAAVIGRGRWRPLLRDAYVEGETLRGRLTHEKQLPVDDAIRLAREVASALDYAHRRRRAPDRDRVEPGHAALHEPRTSDGGEEPVESFGHLLVRRGSSTKC